MMCHKGFFLPSKTCYFSMLSLALNALRHQERSLTSAFLLLQWSLSTDKRSQAHFWFRKSQGSSISVNWLFVVFIAWDLVV
jgi:hypothetical protein